MPGKELSVRVTRQPRGTYLNLEYRNINTNRVLFSHQYQLSRHSVHGVLQASSQDSAARPRPARCRAGDGLADR